MLEFGVLMRYVTRPLNIIKIYGLSLYNSWSLHIRKRQY